MENEKNKISEAMEIDDEMLEQVSGGTDMEEEEEEDIPTYEDIWDAYVAMKCVGKECYNCYGCGLLIPVTNCICPRCGRRH